MESSSDYLNDPVSEAGKKGAIHVASVWLGFIIVVGIMAVGGGLVPLMSLGDLVIAITVGNFILGGFAALTGYVAASSGLSFTLLTTKLFQNASWRAVSLYPAVALVGWYAIECAIFGNLIGIAFDLSIVQTRIAMALSAIGFAVSAFYGFRAIKWVSAALVPIIVATGSYAAFIILTSDSLDLFASSDKTLSIAEGIGPVIGSWALGVVAAYPDLARFCRSPRTAALIGFFGIFVFNSLTLLLGVAGAAYTGQYDPALILIGLGVIPLALVLGVANLWTTNDSNLYSASLGFARALNIDRKTAVAICAGLGLIVALFDPTQFSFFFAFLGFLGNTAPALGGVIFGGYMYMNHKKIKSTAVIAPWSGWISGSLASYFAPGLIAVPLGFAVGFGVWLLVHRTLSSENGRAVSVIR